MKKIVQIWLMIILCVLCCSLTLQAEESVNSIELQTPHAILMEASTGKVLLEKNPDEKLHPASVTKIMTVLLIFDAVNQGKISMEEMVSTSAHAKSMGGSQVFLEQGEEQSVETMLKCILIASGNDAAVAMAEKISGSEEAFVAEMNRKAKELKMEHTNFVDCCGLTDSPEHFTSARDVAIMSNELLNQYPQVLGYSQTWMEDITHVTENGSKVFTLTNTNKLLRGYSGCDGLKTGSTSRAKYCLSATAMRNGIRLIAVVMTAPDSKTRFAEAGKLLDYGYARCRKYQDEKMESLPMISVKGSRRKDIRVHYRDSFTWISTENEDFSKITHYIKWNSDISAPAEAGDEVGCCIYELDGKEIGRVDILLNESVEKSGFFDCFQEIITCWTI